MVKSNSKPDSKSEDSEKKDFKSKVLDVLKSDEGQELIKNTVTVYFDENTGKMDLIPVDMTISDYMIDKIYKSDEFTNLPLGIREGFLRSNSKIQIELNALARKYSVAQYFRYVEKCRAKYHVTTKYDSLYFNDIIDCNYIIDHKFKDILANRLLHILNHEIPIYNELFNSKSILNYSVKNFKKLLDNTCTLLFDPKSNEVFTNKSKSVFVYNFKNVDLRSQLVMDYFMNSSFALEYIFLTGLLKSKCILSIDSYPIRYKKSKKLYTGYIITSADLEVTQFCRPD